jgi:23S rRNA pseudouridine1911/1915/1917 synthase
VIDILDVLDVLYEDDVLLFINKPPRLVVQRGYDPDEPTLEELASAHAGQPVHVLQRLDRGTSGVIFFSKSSKINVKITRQFDKKQIRKTYFALCEGELAERQTVDAPIIRIGAIKFAVGDGGRRAVTHVEPLSTTPSGSLLKILLETGRTHQIRVHLSAIGHPLLGDWLYGDRDSAERPMLHASMLEMTHPVTRQPLRVGAPLATDFLNEAQRRGIDHESGHSALSMLHVNH